MQRGVAYGSLVSVAAFAKDLLSARDELQELSFFLVALQPVPLQMIFCSLL